MGHNLDLQNQVWCNVSFPFESCLKVNRSAQLQTFSAFFLRPPKEKCRAMFIDRRFFPFQSRFPS
jgi:hypothetical protein